MFTYCSGVEVKQSYDKSITMLCPTCASAEFIFDNELDLAVRVYACMSCNHEFSHDAILASNANRVSVEVEQIKKEFIDDVRRDFRKAFKGMKGWKIS